MNTFGKRPSMGEMLLQHVIAFLICIVFPGLVTFFAPASWITFQRSGGVVRCTARTCVFFVVPFKVQQVDQVQGIGQRERAGETKRQRKYGRETNKKVSVDGEGFLEIKGLNDHYVEVSVSPASLKSVVARATNFLNSTESDSTTIFAIANWKFGALMGGVLTSFTLLYVVGYSLALLKFVFVDRLSFSR